MKEIGKLLFKGTMVEEIHETAPDADETTAKLKKDNDPYTYGRQLNCIGRIQILTTNGLGLFSPENFPKQHIPDILTPPPNAG